MTGPTLKKHAEENFFMLFHIIAQHDHTTCGRVQNGKVVPLPSTAMPWINGNEHVKVVGAWGYPVEHKVFAVIESDSFEEVTKLFESHLAMGPVEVLPVSDRLQWASGRK